MAYRTFTRTWWKNDACTIPGAGRKSYAAGETFDTEAEAAAHCREYNIMRFGSSRRGKRGLCMEFEERG